MVTRVAGEHCGDLVELGGTGLPERRMLSMHHVVVRQSDEGFEALRISLKAKGEVIPVFSVVWAAHAYRFAQASDDGWYAKAYDADEMISLLDSLGNSVEWVALDPSPDHRTRDEVANVMPRERFVDYLSCFRDPTPLLRSGFKGVEDVTHGADND